MYIWSHVRGRGYSQGWGMGHSSPTPLPEELYGRNPLYFDFCFYFISFSPLSQTPGTDTQNAATGAHNGHVSLTLFCSRLVGI